MATEGRQDRPAQDTRAIPYHGAQPVGMLADFVEEGALNLDADERLWVPQAPDVKFRPLLFSVSQGYFVNLLRVRKAGILSRHRHTGPVHALVLRGAWHYLEHDWYADTGNYAFEPPGETHTLEVLSTVSEMITLFHVTGAYIYVEPDGTPVGVEDVFTKLAAARAHYEAIGLGASYADKFIR
jgi:2,4'-dihydroxyacetophenone dioxygenase